MNEPPGVDFYYYWLCRVVVLVSPAVLMGLG